MLYCYKSSKGARIISAKKLSLFLLVFCSFAGQLKAESKNQVASILVAVSRYQIEGGQTLENFYLKLNKDINFAKKNGAAYLLIPELVNLDLFPKNPKDVPKAIKKGVELSGSIENFLETKAKEERLTIIGASQYVDVAGKVKNRGYVFGPEGKLGDQDKIYPTPWERKFQIFPKGDKEIKLFKTADFSFVILICHDAEFPDISSSLRKIKPEVVFVPYQADSLEGRNRVAYTARARSIEHMSYTIAGGATSKEGAKWHTYQGGAHLFSPQNKYFPVGGQSLNGPGDPAIFSLNIERLRKSRSDPKQVYPARDI